MLRWFIDLPLTNQFHLIVYTCSTHCNLHTKDVQLFC